MTFFVYIGLKYMEAFTAGQECTAVLFCVLLVVLGVVRIKHKRWQGYRQRKEARYVPSNISEQRMFLESELQGHIPVVG